MLEFITYVFNDVQSELLGQPFNANWASEPIHTNFLWPSIPISSLIKGDEYYPVIRPWYCPLFGGNLD